MCGLIVYVILSCVFVLLCFVCLTQMFFEAKTVLLVYIIHSIICVVCVFLLHLLFFFFIFFFAKIKRISTCIFCFLFMFICKCLNVCLSFCVFLFRACIHTSHSLYLLLNCCSFIVIVVAVEHERLFCFTSILGLLCNNFYL